MNLLSKLLPDKLRGIFARVDETVEIKTPQQLASFMKAQSAGHELTNLALLRCILLISESLAMLPLNLMKSGKEKEHAKGEPLYRVLKKFPNASQTAYEFKRQMQLNVLFYGNAYAYIIRSGKKIMGLEPLSTSAITVKKRADFRLEYHYSHQCKRQVFQQHEILHIKDFSFDGVMGESRVTMAARALGIARDAEEAIQRFFSKGVMARGALTTDTELSDAAFDRLKQSMEEYGGPDSNHKFMVLEQGLKPILFGNSAADGQHIENRNHQIEEVARAFGVPRPLLMMDDTSWGSGIEQLAIYFVQYTLLPWFTCWEQAIERSLLSDSDEFYVKFNERALLRGTLKDQAEFFAKALGAGGHGAWYTQNEVRDLQDMAPVNDELANTLKPPITTSTKGKTDESIETTRD